MALRADDVDLGRDRVLVERYQAGDSSAFDDLYRRYFSRLQRYCARRVHNPELAEEIAQEAFVRALQALPTFAGDRRFYPWMTVIASRLCVDHHRRSWRTEVSDEVDTGHVDDGHDHVFAEVDLAHLDIAMQRLAPRHREVLEMREREGLSYHAIAERMEVNVGTVEALLHRARKALRREFLAVSGEGMAARLAGIPLLGWMVERLDRVKSRLPELSQLAQPITVGAVSFAMVAAPAMFDHHHDGGSEPVTVAADAHGDGHDRFAELLRNAALAAAAHDVDGDAGGDGAGSGADLRSPAPKPPGRRIAVSNPGVYVGDEKPREWIDENDEKKVFEAGPVKVGADPVQIANDLATLPGRLFGGK